VAVHVSSAGMSSTETGHGADERGDGWHVSWLPDRSMTRNQAITALHLAELYADQNRRAVRKWRVLMRQWEDEIGIDERYRPTE